MVFMVQRDPLFVCAGIYCPSALSSSSLVVVMIFTSLAKEVMFLEALVS